MYMVYSNYKKNRRIMNKERLEDGLVSIVEWINTAVLLCIREKYVDAEDTLRELYKYYPEELRTAYEKAPEKQKDVD